MKRYVTRPEIVSAEMWTGDLKAMEKFMGRKPFYEGDVLYIDNGEHLGEALIGDYVVKKGKDHFFPCKKEVFITKYEDLPD